MQFFIEQSETYKKIKTFSLTENTVGMTEEIENDIQKIMDGELESLHDDIDVLCFAHKWKMAKTYGLIREHVKNEMFRNKYDTRIIENKVYGEIWSDMFKTENDMEKIALCGNVWLMKIAHENGCPWNKWTCELAAKNGHVDCLKYAHENGCLWDEWTCAWAIAGGHADCMNYANKCLRNK
jgi:hypothetical protein